MLVLGNFFKLSEALQLSRHKMAAAADTVTTENFPAFLKAVIEEGGYSPKQIFNVDETGLFWKRMPHLT